VKNSTLRKGPLTWIAIGVLLFAGIVGLISREMKRQRGKALTARSASMKAEPAATSDVRLLPISNADHSPAPLGVRYPHRQMAMNHEGYIAAVYDLANGTGFAVATSLDPRDNSAQVAVHPGKFADLSQPTLGHCAGSFPPVGWVGSLRILTGEQQLQLHASIADDFSTWTELSPAENWIPGEPAFPVIATTVSDVIIGTLWTDDLGASGVCLTGGMAKDGFRAEHIIRRSVDWQTWQPPDIRFIDDDHIAMVLRAEAPPRMSGKTREVDSAILCWRFPLDGVVPEPEILMPAIPGQFTERPVLAADHEGNLAVAIGHWGTPQPEGLRGYEMTILLAEGMSEWRAVAPPIPNQVNIATAQPQLGRIGDSLLLVYALEVNEIATPTAHRIQWVRSLDAGLTWTAAALLLPEPGPGVRDYPLDLIMGDTTATLLLQRQTPAPEREDSIVVDPPSVAMFAAQWEWKQ